MQKLLCKTCIYSTLYNVALFVDVICCEGCITHLNFLNRDLKHQDGRWRRGRHIRVKAEARPASRFTHLSMLSNIATATSRQFLKKIPPRKYLENKSSFGEFLVAYD